MGVHVDGIGIVVLMGVIGRSIVGRGKTSGFSSSPLLLHVPCSFDDLADEDFGEACDGLGDGVGNRLGEGLIDELYF